MSKPLPETIWVDGSGEQEHSISFYPDDRHGFRSRWDIIFTTRDGFLAAAIQGPEGIDVAIFSQKVSTFLPLNQHTIWPEWFAPVEEGVIVQ